jgi:RNA:NAD 2'-phosphotransferase (TPT1/KptA family)/8-oxo-dGTP pyrophosphatase MutT (NUDIX family)
MSKISKSMTYLLRHGAFKERIAIQDDGYMTFDDVKKWLLDHSHCVVTDAMILEIVAEDKKTRFSVKDQGPNAPKLIRANQGHSITVNVPMHKYTQDNILIHGSYAKNRESILSNGLQKMSRQHIHMTVIPDDTSTEVSASKWKLLRHDIDLYVIVNAVKARALGLEFVESENSVILTEGPIPPECLTLVPAPDRKSACYGMLIRNAEGDVITVTTPSGNNVGFPKGKKKKGENALACAYREVQEETGLKPSDLVMTGELSYEINEKYNCPTAYYHAITDNLMTLQCEDPDELSVVSWSTIESLMAMPDSILLQRRKVLLKEKVVLYPLFIS